MYTFLNLSCSEPGSKGRREGELSFNLDHPPAWTRFTWLKRRLTCTNRQTWAARSWSGWGQGQLCHLRNLRWLHQRPGTAEESHAVDSQGSFVFSPLSEDNFFPQVKIHPKMIYNRPPLNCQKCQFRFFTDQGLERHLLGSHGLVTASMQDAANKGQDSGRCPVCGKVCSNSLEIFFCCILKSDPILVNQVYQWKLLNHVAKDHGKTLKPAHLSYKCTVCTATFGQYKLFENHVYTAHSGVAKKGDKAKQVVGRQS